MDVPGLLGADFTAQLRLPESQQHVEIQRRQLSFRQDCRARQPFRFFFQYQAAGDALQGHQLKKQMMRRAHLGGGKFAGHSA